MGFRRMMIASIIVIILFGSVIGCSGQKDNSRNLGPQTNSDTQTISTTEETALKTPTPTVEPTKTVEPTPIAEPTVDKSYDSIENGPVSIYTIDGQTLFAVITLPEAENDRHVALILGHERDSNYHSWDPFIEELTNMGYTIIAFDFRGHGESSGSKDFRTLKEDVDSVIGYLNYQGFDLIVCVGASQGGTGCLASTLTTDSIIGIAMISSPMNIQTRHILKSYLGNLTIPKLIMVDENDFANNNTPGFVDDILRMYEWSAEPKLLYLGPGILHGASILMGESGIEARSMFIDFLSTILESLE